MRIKFTHNGETAHALLDSNPAAIQFYKQLPLTLNMEDFAAAEKIATLPKPLSQQGLPAGTDAKAGDITYYAPWGNLALFYKNAGYANGLIKLGAIEQTPQFFKHIEQGKVLIEAD